MAKEFQSGRGASVIREERQFTNPVVRFIRKDGRIIPIINRRKVGRKLENAGGSLMLGGAALATGGAITKKASSALKAALKSRAKKQAKAGFKVGSAFGRHSANFILGRKATFALAEDIDRMRNAPLGAAARKIGRGGKGVAKFIAKHPGKLGGLLATTGLISRTVGGEIQLDSEFGYDIGADF